MVGTIAAIGLLLIVLTGRKLPQVKGSLSQDDAREILSEFHHARWLEAHASLTNRQFRLFWRSASENFRLRLIC